MAHSELTGRGALRTVAVMLIVTVVLQVLYMVFLGGPQPAEPGAALTQPDIAAYFTDRWSEVAIVWTVELVAFAAIALGALIALAQEARGKLAWAAIALAGVFNLAQIGIGLSVFRPIALASDALFPLFGTVVGAAFFFYFLAKAFLGFAAIVLGLGLLKSGGGATIRITGAIAIVVGAAALALNLAGTAQGLSWVLFAGASGTLAALLVAIATAITARTPE